MPATEEPENDGEELVTIVTTSAGFLERADETLDYPTLRVLPLVATPWSRKGGAADTSTKPGDVDGNFTFVHNKSHSFSGPTVSRAELRSSTNARLPVL